MTDLGVLRKFARYAAFIPDRSKHGIGDVSAADYRAAEAICRYCFDNPEMVRLALRPFARAGEHIPEHARNDRFGCSPFTYGDFMRAAEALDIQEENIKR